MIDKLQIRGFGANEKKDIDIGSGVTSITGRSYIGKSWILRALRWTALNKPTGDSFINWNCKQAKVQLSIDDYKITRLRSKSVNSYRLNDKKPYVAFGNEVPTDIAKIVNLSEINFQTQHSTPFWFSETAGEVSRQLNTIVNLELIDTTLANLDSEIRETNSEIKLTEARLDIAIEQKKNLAYVEDMDKDLKKLEKQEKQLQENVVGCVLLAEKIELVRFYGVEQENAAQAASDGLNVVSIGKLFTEIAEKALKLQELIDLGINQQKILKNRPPVFNLLRRLNKQLKLKTSEVTNLTLLITTIGIREQTKCQNEERLELLKASMKKLMTGRCPICGKMMS